MFVRATVCSYLLNYVFLCVAKEKSVNSIYLKGDLARHKGSEERIIKLITETFYLYSDFQTQWKSSQWLNWKWIISVKTFASLDLKKIILKWNCWADASIWCKLVFAEGMSSFQIKEIILGHKFRNHRPWFLRQVYRDNFIANMKC